MAKDSTFWTREIESKARQNVPTSYELVTQLLEILSKRNSIIN